MVQVGTHNSQYSGFQSWLSFSLWRAMKSRIWWSLMRSPQNNSSVSILARNYPPFTAFRLRSSGIQTTRRAEVNTGWPYTSIPWVTPATSIRWDCHRCGRLGKIIYATTVIKDNGFTQLKLFKTASRLPAAITAYSMYCIDVAVLPRKMSWIYTRRI